LLQQTDRATDLATEMPLKKRRDFCRLRTNRQTPFRESTRGRDSIEWRYQQHPSRGCSFAGRPPQSSANKEQRLRIYEKQKLRGSNVALRRQSPRRRGRDRQHAGRVRCPKEEAPGVFTPPGADFSGGLSNLSVSSRRASRRLLRRRFSYSSAPSL